MGLFTVKVKMPWSPRGNNEERNAERDAEAEIARNLWKHHKILPPTSRVRNAWDWLLLTLVVISCWQIPFVLSFELPSSAKDTLNIIESIVDVFFWFDIFLIFNTSYFEEDDLIYDRKKIGRRYGTSWCALLMTNWMR